MIVEVISAPKEGEYYQQFDTKIISIENKSNSNHYKIKIFISKEEQLKFGDIIQITGTFQEIDTIKNTGGFSYQNYLKQEGIYGALKVETIQAVENRKSEWTIEKFFYQIREEIKEKLKQYLQGDEFEFLISIILGDKSHLSESVITNFQSTNLSHLIAISGAHISYIVMVLTYSLKQLKIGVNYRNWIISFFLIFYTFLVGNSPSAFRAVAMCVMAMIAQILHKRVNSIQLLEVSLLISLLINPYDLQNVSLLFSYGSVLGIFLFEKKIEEMLNQHLLAKIKLDKRMEKSNILHKFFQFLTSSIAISLSVQILILPIMIYQFNTFCPYFMMTNMISIPIFSGIMIFSFIFIFSVYFFPIVSVFFSFIVKRFIQILFGITNLFSNFPKATIKVITPSLGCIIFYYVFIFIISQKMNQERIIFGTKIKKLWKNKKRYCFIIIVTALLFSYVIIIPKGLQVYFIDVGQGDACLLISQTNQKILIDGGGSEAFSSRDVGKDILIPYLLDKKITQLDYIFISHFDADHVRTDY